MNIVLSGIKPTGIPTLGNYLGALKNFVRLQNSMTDYEFFVFVADLHAITTPQDPKTLRQNIKNVAALYLACGLNPERLVLFIQSEVNAHIKLGYAMQSICYMGELERMTQYKDSKTNTRNYFCFIYLSRFNGCRYSFIRCKICSSGR